MNLDRITKNPKILALAFIVVIIILILLALRSSLKDSTFIKSSGNVPSFLKSKEDLTLIKTEPDQGERVVVDYTSSTGFIFNRNIDSRTLLIDVNPKVDLVTKVYSEKPNELWIYPKNPGWQSDISYTVTIKKGLMSVDGNAQLKKDIQYSFVIRYPDTIPYIE